MKDKIEEPNLFEYATKELSQDAFFCWFISWSRKEYKNSHRELHNRSREFLASILSSKILGRKEKVTSLEVKKQYKNIDFFVIINKSIIILFEDKVDSENHDNQLERYYDIIQEEYSDCFIEKVYLKTDIVWEKEKKAIKENGYKLLDLSKLVKVLKPETNNAIYDDFVNHINIKLKNYNSYLVKPFTEWDKQTWDGFLYDLAPNFKGSSYGKHYVGEEFWFILKWRDDIIHSKCCMSFEFFSKKCGIKAHIYDERINKRNFRDKITPILENAYKKYSFKVKNKIGKSATVLEFSDYFVLDDNGLLVFDATVAKLKKMVDVFKRVKIE